jgi:hypothetical protein
LLTPDPNLRYRALRLSEPSLFLLEQPARLFIPHEVIHLLPQGSQCLGHLPNAFVNESSGLLLFSKDVQGIRHGYLS